MEKYLDLLSKVFVVYKLGAFSRNMRKEVSKAGKWYFYDNGIRNAIIGDFKDANSRMDLVLTSWVDINTYNNFGRGFK